MYVSLCLIAKNENSYLQEWLDYHILLGVEHFWIYDNESTVPLKDALKGYIDSGWVTVNLIKGHAMQLFAYDHCIQTYGSQSRWIGFIDTDEFIVTHAKNSIKEYLSQFEAYGGFAISSLFFGYGNNLVRPAGGQIISYKKRAPNRYSRNRLVKTFVQPDKVLFPISPHSFLFKEHSFCVNENGHRVDSQEFPCHVETIQINHYFTRSKQEWDEKLRRGGGDGTAYTDNRLVQVNQYCTVDDDRIIHLLKKILPDSPAVESAWKKKNGKDAQDFLEILRRAAEKVAPGEFVNSNPQEVVPRPELIEFKKEMGMGIALLDKGKIEEARRFLADQISKFPFDPIRYTNYASVCLMLKDYQSAWNATAQAWRLAPQSLYVLLAMTDYFYAIGDFAQTEKTCLLVAAQGDLEPISIAVLALARWKQGKKQEALLTAQPVLSRLKDNDLENPIFKELQELMA